MLQISRFTIHLIVTTWSLEPYVLKKERLAPHSDAKGTVGCRLLFIATRLPSVATLIAGRFVETSLYICFF